MKMIYLIIMLCPLPFASARPVWGYLFAVLVSFASVLFIVFSKSAKNRNLPKIFYLPVASVICLILMGAAQVFFGWSVAPEGTIRTSIYALSYLTFFFLVFESVKDTLNLPGFFRIIGLTVTVYSIYGLVIYFSGNEKVLWFDKWTSLQGLTSTFVNRNNFAAYAGIGINCLIAYSFWLLETTSSKPIVSKTQLLDFLSTHSTQAMVLTLSLMIVFTALLLTGSRAGIVSVIIAITYTGVRLYFLSRSRPGSQRNAASLNKILPVFLICLSAMFVLSGDLVLNRLNSGLVENYRLEIYPLLINLIQSGPAYGTGLGSFSEVFAQYRTIDLHIFLLRAHNDYLEILLTAGPFAGGIFIAFLLCFVMRLILSNPPTSSMRPFSIASTSILIQLALHSSVDFPLQIPAIAITVSGVMGANALFWHNYLVSK